MKFVKFLKIYKNATVSFTFGKRTMISTSLFKFAEYLTNVGKKRKWYGAKLYEFLVFHSLVRLFIAIHHMIHDIPEDTLIRYDPFIGYFYVRMFNRSINVSLCMVSFLIYALFLERLCFYKISTYGKYIFLDFKRLRFIFHKYNKRFIPWRVDKSFQERFHKIKLEIGPFLPDKIKMQIILLMFESDFYVHYLLQIFGIIFTFEY